MIVFRLSKKEYAYDLSGRGAEKSGGRWNSKGTAMVYTGETRALCTTEIAVHTPLGILPTDYQLITIHIPDEIKLLEVDPNNLPEGWRSYPHIYATQHIGDTFVKEAKMAAMKVPSVIVPGEFNILINPAHPASKKIKIHSVVPFGFDKRLFTV